MNNHISKINDHSTISTGTLGTFSGVFTPSILTILGIILFMRLGYVIGNAGLGRALIIIALANSISILTSFSLSAIATNLKVKGGGDYYLISRTLGLEFGGAIGIVLFLAQSVSIAFYCIGFGEALTGMLNSSSGILPQIIAALAVSFLFIFAWLGADWATKFQFVVMASLFVALLSFFIGGFIKWENVNLISNWSSPSFYPGFWIIFAIFFPAVTGFTQGVSMSGDLKDAGKSLPIGTFLAVAVSILIYFASAFLFAGALPGDLLANDYGAMKKVAYLGYLINVGVIAATLSSAMASFLGAPRILQSLAQDHIFPFLLPFAKGYGSTSNPRRGVLLSAGIAFATIGLGKLNLIAPIVSMFFLISYGLLNYATYFEARSASPSFRPRFKWYDYKFSLLGWLACLGVMLAIDIRAGVVAVAVLFAIFQYLKRTAGPSRWADSRRSYHLQRARENILAAAAEPEHFRDWRPYILAFSDSSERREHLLIFSSWIEGGSGLTTVVRILEGEGGKMLKLRSEVEAELQKEISQHELKIFPLVISAPDFQTAVQVLIQSFGIGPLQVNTVLINWRSNIHHGILRVDDSRFTKNLRVAFRFGCNIILLDAKEDRWEALEKESKTEKTIDIYWSDDKTSSLMLLLAYLITKNENWADSKIRILASNHRPASGNMIENLEKTIQDVRIEAEPVILDNTNIDTIFKQSAESSLVFLPFRIRRTKLSGPFDLELDDLLKGLPITALVLAAEDIDLDAQPEEGKAGELAVALDAFTAAEEKSKKASEDAEKASRQAEERLEDLKKAIDSGAEEDLMERVKAVVKAKEDAGKAARRSAKALAKSDEAAKIAEDLGGDVSDKKEKDE